VTTTVIFDLGGVLLDWNPRHLFGKLFDDKTEMEDFLAQVCNTTWIAQFDAGRPMAEGVAELTAQFPEYAGPIEAFQTRWPETLVGAFEETVNILAALRKRRHRLYALSNFSAETFPHAMARFTFLQWFDGIVISGEVGVVKPDSRIYRVLFEHHGIDPTGTVFIDDVPANVAAGQALGLDALHFTTAGALRAALERRSLL